MKNQQENKILVLSPYLNSNIMKIYFTLFILMALASCGVQKKMARARVSSEKTKTLVHDETARLDSIQNALYAKRQEHSVDSVLNHDMQRILDKLNGNLNNAQKTASEIDLVTQNRAAFKKELHTSGMTKMIVLDSFNAARNKREEVYTILDEAVKITAYKLFHLAAFFAPGVYQIPESATSSITADFTPIIDSASRLANKYSGVEREIRIVFVGYSDSTPVIENSSLYKNLEQSLKKENPTQGEMNLLLSSFRAQEMSRNMKFLLNSQAYKFNSFNNIKISYVSYGKGEEYPSSTITDYKPSDERRRIVLSYWTVLPKLSGL